MRALDAARRQLAGPDGPWTLALALSLAALLQLALIQEGETSIIGNLLETLPLALTRRRLLLAAWLTTLGTWLLIADPTASFTLAGIAAQVIVAYLVAARRRRRASVLLAVPFLFAAVAAPPDQGHFSTVLLLVLVVGALAFGDARRQRGQAIAERDATRRAMRDTLRDQAATQERARIARELHDVVAHHVSMVAVQAETARLTTPGMPRRAASGSPPSATPPATRSPRCAACSASCAPTSRARPSALRSRASTGSRSSSTRRAQRGRRCTWRSAASPRPSPRAST